MLNQFDYCTPEVLSGAEPENLFTSEEDAIFALYEQLFFSRNTVCKQTVLNSMKYLIFSKSMKDQMEEMEHMLPCDVDVVHHREIEKEMELTTKEIKKKLYDILEGKIF